MFLRRRYWLFWIGLLCYWPALFIGTHLPPVQMQRCRGNDFILHSFAFFVLTLFFWLACFRFEKPDFKTRRPYVIFAILSLYAVLDEWTQAWVQRTVSLDDWLADFCGILAALAALWAFRRPLCWLTLYWVLLCIVRYYPHLRMYVSIMPEHFARYRVVYLALAFAVLTVFFVRGLSPAGRFLLHVPNLVLTVAVLGGYAVLDLYVRQWTGHGFAASDLVGSLSGILIGCLFIGGLLPRLLPPDDET